MLHRLAGLFKDYCGVLNEEALRMNFTLAYEILDEVIVSEHDAPLLYCVYICYVRTCSHNVQYVCIEYMCMETPLPTHT